MTSGKKHSNTVLLAYAALAFPLAALTMPVYIFLPTFYAEDLGLGFSLVGVTLLFARIWDVVTDPVVGILSDATKTKLGRRKTWVLGGMIPTILGTWFLMNPPADLQGFSGALYLLLASAVLYLGWTCMILSLQAWGAELSTDYHERSRISAWREAFTVGGILGTLGLLAAFGFGSTDTAGQSLGIIAWITAILLPLTVMACLKFVPEPKVISSSHITFRSGLKVLANNKSFRLLAIAYLINGIANGLPATLFILFVRHILDMPEYVNQLLFLYFLCGFLAVPLWLKLSYHFGKHVVWCGAMIWACAFFLLVPFVGSGDIWLYTAIVVLTGISLGADLVLPASMQADVVDVDTLETGRQRTGLYFAIWGMVTKLSLALAAGLAFPALDIAGFSGEDNENLWALVSLYALIPIGFKVVAIAIMLRYPLKQETVDNVRSEIIKKWG